MTSMQIVVLGGTGFVGRHLVAALAADGHRLTVLSRNRSLHPDLLLPPEATLRDCEVYSGAALVRALDGADAAINLVGILNERGDSGRGFQRAHVELTRTLIAACREAEVSRLLQMSALNAGRGRSHYLISRGQAEEAVMASGLDWTIFEPSVIFGPGDGLFCRFAALLKYAPVLPIAGGETRFAPVYVGDVVEAYRRALTRRDTIGQCYELYGPEVFALKRLVRMTAQAMGKRRCVIPLPYALGRMQAELGEWLPGKPISRDNFRSLALDSVGGIDGLHRLDIVPTAVGTVLPDILGRGPSRQSLLDGYRRGRAG